MSFIESIPVRFSMREISPESRQVVIFPEDVDWNDFGFHIRCRYSVLSPRDDRLLSGPIYLGFVSLGGESSSRDEGHSYRGRSLSGLLQSLGREACDSGDLPQFFTMLPAMAEYRAVVESLGVEGADLFLRSVNDLVVSRDSKSLWFDQAVASEVFSLGFMRNSEPFFAFHNADSLLNGVSDENLTAISKSIQLSFSLDGFENEHDITFRFGAGGLVPRRINILIGKNGVGKSQVLKKFCRAALGYNDSGVTFRDCDTGSERPMISRVLAVSTPGETGNTFPAERKKTQKLYYRRLQLTRNGRSRLSNSIGASLVQLIRKREVIGDNDRWDIFLGAINKVLPADALIISANSGPDLRLVDLAAYRSSEQTLLDMWSNVDFSSDPKIQVGNGTYPLSSGQLTFFKFALLCSLYIENGSFVLMDEPETHMHPNMISDFIDLLDGLLEATGSQAIIATHSAYFVREVPSDQVHVFQLAQDSLVYIDRPRLNTFGATIDSISQFVFNENVEVRLTDKIFEKAKNMRFQDVDEQLSGEVSLAALMDIRRRFEENV